MGIRDAKAVESHQFLRYLIDILLLLHGSIALVLLVLDYDEIRQLFIN